MSNIDKYVINDPKPEEVAEIKSVLAKSDDLVSEIILSSEKIERTNKKIKLLVESASQQKEKKVGFWSGKKIAIESLQEFADQQADSISELWENQQLVFEQFEKLAETSNKLVFLGVANAAVTRALIEQLKTKSSKSLSEDARRHLLNVIKDLERQADAQDRINRLRDTTSSAISKESEDRKTDIKKVNSSIDNVKDYFFKLLKEERSKRIAEFERFQTLMTVLESDMSNMNATINDTIRSSNESHSAKEELLQNEITQLQSKNKVSMWIGIVASLVAFISLILNFII